MEHGLSTETKKTLLMAKRRQEAGDEPKLEGYTWQPKRETDAVVADEAPDLITDRWRADWFGWWLRTVGITVNGLATVSGVARTTVMSLAGSGGAKPLARWSKIKRETLDALLDAIHIAAPLTRAQLREHLSIPTSHAPEVWSSERLAQPETETGQLTCAVTWDPAVAGPPWVCRSADGGLILAQNVATGLTVLGGLSKISGI